MLANNTNYKKEMFTIIGSFLILTIIVVLVEIYSINALNTMNKTTNNIYNHPLKVSNAALNIRLNILKIHRDMKDVVLSDSMENIRLILNQINLHEKEIYRSFDVIKNDILGEEGYALYVDAKNQYDNWKPIRNEVVFYINKNNYKKAIDITKNKGAKHVSLLEEKANKLNQYARNKATYFRDEASSTFENKYNALFIIVHIVFIFFISITYYIAKRFYNYATLVNNKTLELQRSNTLLEESQKIANMCSWENDHIQNKIFWSEDLFEMLNLNRKKFKININSIFKLIHPEDRKKVISCYRDAMKNSRPYLIEYRIVNESEIIYVLESAILKFNSAGDIEKVVGILQNITEKKLAEQRTDKQMKINNRLFNSLEISIWNEDLTFVYDELEKLRDKGIRDFEKYLNDNPNFVVLLANSIKILGVNSNTVRMFNAKSEEEFLSSIADTFGSNALEIFKSELIAIWNNEDYFRKESNFKTLDGKELKGIVSFSIPNDRSEFASMPISILDVTELKEKDKFILLQSRYAAMGEMISMIAHQWRQPITTVTMIANNILADVGLENEIDLNTLENYSRDVLKQTAHLSKTIDDFRDFFKDDSKSEEILSSEIMDEVINIIGSSLKNNNIELEINTKVDFSMNIKKGELIQTLINLINNSKDVLVQHKIENPQIVITTIKDHRFNKILIADNGIGISKDIMARIFEPYFTTKQNQNGTGLGLYISKVIVEDHLMGKLEVENNDKNGATFIISIPQS